MANVMLEILDGFSLVWVLIYRGWKPAFLQVTLNLNWIKCRLEVDILIQIVLTLLTFLASPILRNIPICCRRFLFDVSYNVNFQLNL